VLLLPTYRKNDAPENVKNAIWYINFKKNSGEGQRLPSPLRSGKETSVFTLHPLGGYGGLT